MKNITYNIKCHLTSQFLLRKGSYFVKSPGPFGKVWFLFVLVDERKHFFENSLYRTLAHRNLFCESCFIKVRLEKDKPLVKFFY